MEGWNLTLCHLARTVSNDDVILAATAIHEDMQAGDSAVEAVKIKISEEVAKVQVPAFHHPQHEMIDESLPRFLSWHHH